MTASCFSTPLAPLRPSAARSLARLPRASRRPVVLAGAGLQAVVIAIALVLAAVLFAPEQPIAQADICERHNGTAACRVW